MRVSIAVKPTFKVPAVLPFCGSARWVAAGLCLAFAGSPAPANPGGPTVAQGNVSFLQNGARLDITASHNAVIDWQRFNIAPGETTTFIQPSANSVVWNRILDTNPSQIWGNLNANGFVVLMNQNGFYFGPNSVVNVGGFLATTAPISPPLSGGSGLWQYQGPPPAASIVNYGSLRAQSGGSLFLVAEKIENHGVLTAPDGTLGLYAGKEVLISDRPDGRGLNASVRLPAGSIDNYGKLIADAGTIALHAQVVNQNGFVQANSVRERQGVIELVASTRVTLGPESVLQAKGDASAASAAGSVTIKSAGTFTDDPGSRIDVAGGAHGGNGGSLEISAFQMNELRSQLDGTAQPGWRSGLLLFDPYDIVLTSAANGSSAPSGTVPWDSLPGGTLRLNVDGAFAGFSQILLQASHDISFDRNTVWDLNQSTGISDAGSLLTLEAGNNIVFGDSGRILSSGGWSVRLTAGADFSSTTTAPRMGIGGIYLNGGPPNANGSKPNLSGGIELADGDITLAAGHEVLVGSGFVRTVAGGNIHIATGDGDVDAGTKTDTYDFSNLGYTVSSRGLGGIGTAGGGNVTIDAGRDVLSYTATIGAFGGGDVRLTAARDIKGRFLLSNGTGTLQAGRDVGSAATPFSLGLVNGGWNVNAGRDLFLNEVYNPNGSLNPNRRLFGAQVPYQFDYAPDAYATLVAGNAVQLIGKGIMRASNTDRLPIYAPRLSITAGAGGVTLANTVILYPSELGSLSVRTADGGPLQSKSGGYYQLVVSDSGSPDYKTFASGHAASPLHLNSGDAGVNLDISGDVQNLFLRSPRQTDVFIHGNALNFSFECQNLAASDVSHLVIGGDFTSRSDRTFVTVSDSPNLDLLTDPILSANPQLGARLTFDPVTHRLGIQGIVSAADRDFLLHPVTYVFDPFTGGPVTDANNNPVTQPAHFTTDTAAIQQLYQNSQDIPTSPLARNGLQVGGPGQFVVSVHNLDLGISSGIRSVGPLNNPALAGISLRGADLRVNLGGDLGMTSSQIASFNGGSIDVIGAGRMDIGSQEQFSSDSTPKGIYTAHGGHVTVQAAGDVRVNGSRIASYDGGDVTVVSQTGDMDAGEGGKGFFYVTTSQLDPVTGSVQNRNDKFFGSGIMALTRTDSDAKVGDIRISAAGSISANAGGVLQLAFNHMDQSGAKVTLDAGGDIKANQSGVLGGNVTLTVKGSIEGLVVANQNVVIDARQNVNVTALASGTAFVSAGDKISGSIVGGGSVSVAGSEVSAAVISTGGSTATSGDTSSAKMGTFNSVAAPTVQKATEEADKTIASKSATTSADEEEEKKRMVAKAPVLARSAGRVTVILPKN